MTRSLAIHLFSFRTASAIIIVLANIIYDSFWGKQAHDTIFSFAVFGHVYTLCGVADLCTHNNMCNLGLKNAKYRSLLIRIVVCVKGACFFPRYRPDRNRMNIT